ncbi:hypothetical protein BpHYR1_010607 [Brachionus plicatilis]|uniref:Uncharacterized protein n=1 Tax=Brachionus plicatilis TaxID=10195 RepID=A0A3M7S790_BRAPC|nr:hypothetical protein BpHYR1_010607 [Brachionus plicatilis]
MIKFDFFSFRFFKSYIKFEAFIQTVENYDNLNCNHEKYSIYQKTLFFPNLKKLNIHNDMKFNAKLYFHVNQTILRLIGTKMKNKYIVVVVVMRLQYRNIN